MVKLYLFCFSSEPLVLKKRHYFFIVNIVQAILKIKLAKQPLTQSFETMLNL